MNPKILNRYVVSLDVHARSTFIYMVDAETGEILLEVNVRGGLRKTLKHIQKYGTPGSTCIIYEAGCLGFYPYRFYTSRGYACKVIAPHSIPHTSRRKKTDRRDSKKNLHHFLSGILSMVNVPPAEQEAARDLNRYRAACVHKLIKVKQQIAAYILRNGLEFVETKTLWTKAHRKWLRTVELPVFRTHLDLLVDELDITEAHIKRVDAKLDEIVNQTPLFRRWATLYRLLPGIGRVGSMTLVLEIGDMTRFTHAPGFVDFVGLMPGKNASGDSDPAIAITKEGNRHVRYALVAAAKSYASIKALGSPPNSDRLHPILREFLSRACMRLHKRYNHLKRHNKHTNKVRCAVARELATFCWELMVKAEPQMRTEDTPWKMAA